MIVESLCDYSHNKSKCVGDRGAVRELVLKLDIVANIGLDSCLYVRGLQYVRTLSAMTSR